MMLDVKRAILGNESSCSQCGKKLRERKRKPCPKCGNLSRTLSRFTEEFLGAEDKAA